MYDDVEDEDEDDEEDHDDDDDDDNDDQHIQSSNNFLWVGSSIVNSPSTGLMMTPENCDLKKKHEITTMPNEESSMVNVKLVFRAC